MKKFAIGVDSDQNDEAPGVVITSMIKVVDAAVYETIKQINDGSFRGGRVETFGLKSKGVDYAYTEKNKHMIPAEVRSKVELIRQEIIDGKIKIPTK